MKPKYEDGTTVIIKETRELATIAYWCYFDEDQYEDEAKYALENHPNRFFKESELVSCTTKTIN